VIIEPTLTRKRLAAVAASFSVGATCLPLGAASAAVSRPSMKPHQSNPTGVRITTVVGPKIYGTTVVQGKGAGGQDAAAAPQAITLLSNTAGGQIAVGTE
jgi:hypothetical protein